MPKAEPPPPPPPRPDPVNLQIRCAAWSCMDFQVNARLQEYQVAHLEEMILARHGDPVQNLALYKNKIDPENKLEPGSEDSLAQVDAACIVYDYYPPLDPFENRPTAGQVHSTNAVITLQTFENGDKPIIEPEKLAWSKVAEHDPWTARRLAAEAAAAAEAARLKAEEEARIAAEKEAKRQAEIEAKKQAKIEAARLKAEQEAAERAEREREEAERLAELAAKDPEAAARAEAELKAKEAKEALEKLPKRSKGGAISLFLGGTAATALGLDGCTKEAPYAEVSVEVLLADIKTNGKISDMYTSKEYIDAYDGPEPKAMLFCKDADELYGDNGWIFCVKDVDKQHFIASISAGMGIPPPIN